MILEARKEAYKGAAYTSASLISRYKGDWLYGKFEFSAKVPGGLGTWPALWMMPTDDEYGDWPKSGEIDIMEYVGMDPNTLYYTAHFQGNNGTGHQSSGTYKTYNQPYNRFIKFTLVWSPNKIEWYADGIKYHTYTTTNTDPKLWPFNKMFYLIMNLAYGGSWADQKGHDDTKLPHKFLIDYVRVYQLQETAGPFSVKIEPSTNGTVEISPNQPTYADGTVVTLTAKPAEGYEFDKWLHVGSANPMNIEVRNDWTITPVFKKKNELILNGDFGLGIKNWGNLYFYSPAAPAATASVLDGVYVINISKPGTANWHIVEQQLNIPVLQGTTYNISFDAWAENPKTMDVLLSKNHDDYGNYFTTAKSISTVRQKFTWKIKMTLPSDDNCRFGFGLGQFTGKVYIDNVSIEKVVATYASSLAESESDAINLFPNPTSGVLEITSRFSGELPATIKLYNLQGQLVSALWENKIMSFGQHLSFNLKEYQISQGIYLLTVSTSERKITRKIIVN